MTRIVRLLLTQHCTARCAYCHNEGQGAGRKQLVLADIARLLQRFATQGMQVDEYVLSGGEPTLHPQLPEIARLCRQSGARVSLNTHGGIPQRLVPALPWVNEVKIHLDSFDPRIQQDAMGIRLGKVLQSIAAVQAQAHVRCVLNHPLRSLAGTQALIDQARQRQLDCKIIALYGQPGAPDIHALDQQFAQWGYWQDSEAWVRPEHRIHTRQCDDHAPGLDTLFIGVDGVRRHLSGPILGQINECVPGW